MAGAALLKFIPFAIVIAFIATRFLSKAYIDRFYYFLGILGVVGLYFAKGDKLLLPDLREQRQQVVWDIQTADFHFRNQPSLHSQVEIGLLIEAKRFNQFYKDLNSACFANQKSATCKWETWFNSRSEFITNFVGRLPLGEGELPKCDHVDFFRDEFYNLASDDISCARGNFDDLTISCETEALEVKDEEANRLPNDRALTPWLAVETALARIDPHERNAMYEQGLERERGSDCTDELGRMTADELRALKDQLDSKINEIATSQEPNILQTLMEQYWPYIWVLGLSLKLTGTTSFLNRTLQKKPDEV